MLTAAEISARGKAATDHQKAAALARTGQALGQPGPVVAGILGRLWDDSFEQGRLAALDELQDRLCVCMK